MDQEQFDKYQHFTEKTIYDLSQKVIELENKLNIITNLLEVSKYINSYINESNLYPLINDMLIGVFGANYSTIYIRNESELEAVAQNAAYTFKEEEKLLVLKHSGEEFVINSETPIYKEVEEEDNVYSCIGVPIKVNNHLLGYILIQHKEKNYFSEYHSKFLSSIGNHIGVAIENHNLQKLLSKDN